MFRKLMLGAVATLGLAASTAVGASGDLPQGPDGPQSPTASADAEAGVYVVWYFEFGRWRGIGPLNEYDANGVLANLHRRGYRAYIAYENR